MPAKYQREKDFNSKGVRLVKQTFLRKCLYSLKALRNYSIKVIYEAAKSSNAPSLFNKLRAISNSGNSVVVTIAYNTPWTISLLTECWQKYCPETTLLVIDNSSNQISSQEISKICSEQGILYLKLPHNRERHPSRSHGLALNWTWKNIICHMKNLNTIGFIDHDCYPIKPWNPASLPSKVAYGLKNPGWIRDQPTWSLWAGYMHFRNRGTQNVTDLPMDFTPNPLDGLDTGGMNWRTFYRKLTPEDYGYSKIEKISLCNLLGASDLEDDLEAQLIDSTFLHLGGAAHKAPWKDIGSTRLASLLRASLISTHPNLRRDNPNIDDATTQKNLQENGSTAS
jgi:hypothetical protein